MSTWKIKCACTKCEHLENEDLEEEGKKDVTGFSHDAHLRKGDKGGNKMDDKMKVAII